MKIEFKDNRIVAIDNNKTIGYIKYHNPKDYSNKRNIDIDYVWVSKRYRRKGIASMMIKFLFKNFKDIIWIDLWTSYICEVDCSWGVYEKMGFKQMTYLNDYYVDGVGTRYMCKKLN